MTSHKPRHADDCSVQATAGSNPCSELPRALSIDEFWSRYGVGRTTAYREIAARRLRAVKVGRRTLITHDAAEAWLASLPSVQAPRQTTTPSRSS
jgi:excisionase family DNA binding protein